MWEIDAHKLRRPRVALIDGEQEDLEFYDLPILFTGFNALESRVLGSFVGIDRAKRAETYFHAIVDEGSYIRFVNRRQNYPETLRNAYYLYLVQWLKGSEAPLVYEITFNEIPERYRPKEEGYCPKIYRRPSLTYPMILHRGNADSHTVSAKSVADLHEQFTAIFKSPHKRMANVRVDVRLQAQASSKQVYEQSSFKFNYLITLDEIQHSFFKSQDDYIQYANNYITYCLNNLPEDAPSLEDEGLENKAVISELWDQYSKLKGIAPKYKESARKEFVKDVLDVAKKLDEVSETLGEDFKEIILANQSADGDMQLGVIDQGYREELGKALEVIATKRGQVKEVDQAPTKYKIHIFDLNTGTRKGRAFYEHPDPRKVAKPIIVISGDEPLAGTKYTESMHENKYIEVIGIGTKLDKVVQRIEIDFNSEQEHKPTPEY